MLERIVSDTKLRLSGLLTSAGEIRTGADRVELAPSFEQALRAPGLSVIAEVKRKSPSRGELSPDLDPVMQSKLYAEGGAAAISVLTEPHHFSGSNEDLEAVTQTIAVPVLRKDFTIHPIQVWEAKGIGASAVLLIVAILDDAMLAALLSETTDAQMDALVEVHSEEEARRAIEAGAAIIGVNNRDLTTFETDLATAERIAPMLADTNVTIGESGIHTPSDAKRMADAGFDAVLVGESLVVADDPADLLRSLRGVT